MRGRKLEVEIKREGGKIEGRRRVTEMRGKRGRERERGKEIERVKMTEREIQR